PSLRHWGSKLEATVRALALTIRLDAFLSERKAFRIVRHDGSRIVCRDMSRTTPFQLPTGVTVLPRTYGRSIERPVMEVQYPSRRRLINRRREVVCAQVPLNHPVTIR